MSSSDAVNHERCAMNRSTAIVLGLVLSAVGAALIIYRTQGGADLAEPLPVLLTLLAVGAFLGGFSALGKAFKRQPPR